MGIDLIRSPRLVPHALVAIGVLLGVIAVGEVVAVTMLGVSTPDGLWLGLATSVPLILGIVYGGYWLPAGELPETSYPRILGWCVAFLVGFSLIVISILQRTETLTAFFLVSSFRWAASLGGAVGILIGVFEAISIQRALEVERSRLREQAAQRERDRLDEFASIVSHDLRNPLNVATSRLELARRECDSEHHAEMATALDRMERIIEDVLWLAREGRDIGVTEPVALREAVETSWAMVADGLDGGDLVLADDLRDATIVADGDRVRQILENLFRNAVEHGGDDVTVSVDVLDVGFAVEDDGPGIPEADRDAVFEAGFTTNQDGTGFGLRIVEQVADAHGWDVRVTEGSAGGARFEITGIEFAADKQPA